MKAIALESANAIVGGALQAGLELGQKPPGVAVLDAAVRPISCQCQDGASTSRLQIAIGAVGVNGGTSDNDERGALAGIAAAGLQAWR